MAHAEKGYTLFTLNCTTRSEGQLSDRGSTNCLIFRSTSACLLHARQSVINELPAAVWVARIAWTSAAGSSRVFPPAYCEDAMLVVSQTHAEWRIARRGLVGMRRIAAASASDRSLLPVP